MQTEQKYMENLEESEQKISDLRENIVPILTQNMSENLPLFVSTYKEIKQMQIERNLELKKWEITQSYNFEKFNRVVDASQKRLSNMLDNITEMQHLFLQFNPNTPQEEKTQQLLIGAMRDMQNMYFAELQLLLNL